MGKQVKELVVDNITYKLTFWTDNWDFQWTRIEKKVWVRPWYSTRKFREDWELIREYWTEDDPIETALVELAKYVTREKKKKEYKKALDNWCQ